MSDPIDFSAIKAAKSRDPEAEMKGLADEPSSSRQKPALRVHDVDGDVQVETFSIGGSGLWFWHSARRVPRSDVHGPFPTEDDALVDARDALRRTR